LYKNAALPGLNRLYSLKALANRNKSNNER